MKKNLLLLLFCFLFAGIACANENAWPQDASDLKADPNVTFGQLENGVRWAFMHNETPKDRLSLQIYVDAGSLMEREDQRGLAHFLEHMAFNGTTHFGPDEMVTFFQRLGMGFGADTNAHTSMKETIYELELPNTTEEVMTPSFQMLHDFGAGMLLKSEEVEKERGVILSEKNYRNTPEYRNYESAINFLLPCSTYGTRMTIGLEDVIKNCDPQVIRDLYNKWYTSDRMVVVGVGGCDLDTFKKYLTQEFSSIKKNENPLPDPDLGFIIPTRLDAKVHIDPELKDTSVEINSVIPATQRVDTAERRIADLKLGIANQIVTRRLDKLSKKDGSVIKSGGSDFFRLMDFADVSSIYVDCASSDWRKAMHVVDHELRKALQYGFNDAEVKEAVANTLNAYKQAAKSASTRQNRQLSTQLAQTVSNNRVFTSPEQNLELCQPILEKLTKEDVYNAFTAAWSNQSRLLYLSGNLPEEGVANTDLMKEYVSSAHEQVGAPEDAKVAEWSYTNFGTPGTVAKENYIKDLDIHEYQLSNNVYVNIKKTDYTADQVLININFGSGKLTLKPEQEGFAFALDNTFINGGLEDLSWDDIKQATAGRSVSVSLSTGAGNFSLSGGCSKSEIDLQMQLLAAYFTHPGFREESVREFKKNLDSIYSGYEHDVIGVFRKDVFRFLSGNDIRFGVSDRSVIDGLDYASVDAWFKQALADSRVEISIVGDIDPDVALKAVLNTFGSLPTRAETASDYSSLRHVNFKTGIVHTFEYDTAVDKGIAAFAVRTTDMINEVKTSYRLNTLASIFGDRLRVKIREELGESYSPMAFNQSSEDYEDYGVLMGLVICQGVQADALVKNLCEISDKLQTNGVTDDELVRALNPMITNYKKQRQTNAYWLYTVLSGAQEKPEKLDWSRTALDDLKSITVEDINALAKQYMKSADAAKFTIVPEAKEEK